MNLQTSYLGLNLPHPFVAGASPLCDDLDMVRRLEDAGAAAIIMHSLFEEQVTRHELGIEAHMMQYEESFVEAGTYWPRQVDFSLGPEEYLAQIGRLKQAVDIPVIASLNGTSEGSWVEYSREIEKAGADALELNMYFLPHGEEDDASEIEGRLLDVVQDVRRQVRLPIAVKLSPFYSSMPNLARRIEELGANGLVLFNRFLQPDIDIEDLETIPRLKLSTPDELLLRIRWLAMLFHRFRLDLAVTGGIHRYVDAVKAVMAGADCVQMVSALLMHGPEHLATVRREFEQWMDEREYESLEQMKGSMSYIHTPDPEAIERANYVHILQSWKP